MKNVITHWKSKFFTLQNDYNDLHMQLKRGEIKVDILGHGVGDNVMVRPKGIERMLNKSKVGVKTGDREGRCKHNWIMKQNETKYKKRVMKRKYDRKCKNHSHDTKRRD